MLQLLYTRLSDSGQFTAVEISESLDAIVGRAPAAEDGTVFIVPWREAAQPNRNAAGAHRQLVEMMFVTALLSRIHDDPRGGERARAFDTFKSQTEDLLAGWTPAPENRPFALVGAESSGLGNGVSIYAQTWSTTRFLTGAA